MKGRGKYLSQWGTVAYYEPSAIYLSWGPIGDCTLMRIDVDAESPSGPGQPPGGRSGYAAEERLYEALTLGTLTRDVDSPALGHDHPVTGAMVVEGFEPAESTRR
jgi:hypothetical protein